MSSRYKIQPCWNIVDNVISVICHFCGEKCSCVLTSNPVLSFAILSTLQTCSSSRTAQMIFFLSYITRAIVSALWDTSGSWRPKWSAARRAYRGPWCTNLCRRARPQVASTSSSCCCRAPLVSWRWSPKSTNTSSRQIHWRQTSTLSHWRTVWSATSCSPQGWSMCGSWCFKRHPTDLPELWSLFYCTYIIYILEKAHMYHIVVVLKLHSSLVRDWSYCRHQAMI